MSDLAKKLMLVQKRESLLDDEFYSSIIKVFSTRDYGLKLVEEIKAEKLSYLKLKGYVKT